MPFSLCKTACCWRCLVGERTQHVQTVAHVTKSHLTCFHKDWFTCWKWFLGISWVLQVVASIWHKDELLSSTRLWCLGGCSECSSLASDLVTLMRLPVVLFPRQGHLFETDLYRFLISRSTQFGTRSLLKPTKIADIFLELCCWQIGFTHLHFKCIVKGSTKIGNEPGLVSIALACSCARSSDKRYKQGLVWELDLCGLKASIFQKSFSAI